MSRGELRKIVCGAGIFAMVSACGAPHGSASTGPGSSSIASLTSTLRELLPTGQAVAAATSAAKGNTRGDPAKSAGLIFDDGRGPAFFSLTLARSAVRPSDLSAQCPDTAYHPYSKCSSRILAGGTRLTLDEQPADQARPGNGVLGRTALVTTADGNQIFLIETNAPDDQADRPTRPALPLSSTALAGIVTSSRWAPFLATIPARAPVGSPPLGERPTTPHDKITTLLSGLLPPRLRIDDAGGSDDFGHVTVDDGQGKSLVAVNVQHWRRDDADIARVFAEAEVLLDGTRLLETRSPSPHGGAGAVTWSADTLDPTGLRVLVVAVNAPGYGVPATRRDPALTVAQLKATALAPAWHHLPDR
ncbi:hypothetical protein VSH64_08750 [Amycolatopsis rhabdoformis]|uniref:Uncharacterized protein n=1 Tax=Amycolatopsis rhabdoformis TaxID=1448059 RepID=A0ABZ1IDN9_9PSEU|nr:hypothetical protein [Amycolatopsis rhabdoformis]WSE32196.1 hypothetical protein VSH64_08750 [Amycolatopsis rhabdoformis]